MNQGSIASGYSGPAPPNTQSRKSHPLTQKAGICCACPDDHDKACGEEVGNLVWEVLKCIFSHLTPWEVRNSAGCKINLQCDYSLFLGSQVWIRPTLLLSFFMTTRDGQFCLELWLFYSVVMCTSTSTLKIPSLPLDSLTSASWYVAS